MSEKSQITNHKSQINRWLLLIVIILAGVLRLYQLGNNPPSLDWDEASLGYNAYSILKTGKDEFGRKMPVSIRSFEDYKPAMYTYLTVPFVAIFGLNEFSVRLPSAIFGILTVYIVFLLIRKIFNHKIGLLTAFLLAISPWHLQFSRIAFEANIGLFFTILGIYLFIKGLENSKFLLFSAIFFALSFYSYHSPRLIIPFLLLGWLLFFRKLLFPKWKYVILGIIIGLIILTPFINEMFTSGKARFSSVTVLTSQSLLEESIKNINYDLEKQDFFGKLTHNRRIIYSIAVIKGYLDHFNLDFLFLKGDASDRHHARDFGMLYLWEAPFIIVGILFFLKKQYIYIWWWFLVAPIASSITTGTPHAVRALFYLPIYQLFASLGIYKIFNQLADKKFIRLIILFLFILNIFYYIQMYYLHTPIESANEWQYGYKQAIEIIKDQEKNVGRIIMTYEYDQPHIFVLFYNQVDPLWYQQVMQKVSNLTIQRAERSFGKYEFRKIDWQKDQYLTDVLFVGTPKEIPQGTTGMIKDIYYPDGTVAFRLVKR